ncbi:MAG TPA: hypothetical protein VGR61_06940, partial [Candidatus Dormibacteraeota bacterium]|nr:hypothetical protein [Candidatus Dormibacteraeota bacterium]
LLAAVSAGRSNVYAQLFVAQGAARVPRGQRVLGSVAAVRAQLMNQGATRVGAEAGLAAAFDNPAGAPANTGVEALAAATREAVGKGVAVSYHQLTGDYGE